jgi:hypothetical protein
MIGSWWSDFKTKLKTLTMKGHHPQQRVKNKNVGT